jgi:hypothetical protein
VEGDLQSLARSVKQSDHADPLEVGITTSSPLDVGITEIPKRQSRALCNGKRSGGDASAEGEPHQLSSAPIS